MPAIQHVNSLRWWQGIDRYCWVVLAIAALGWTFDTMDQNLFNLVRAQSIQSLVTRDGGSLSHAKQIGGWVTAAFMVGWAIGGFVFGMVGDRIGRTRTMVLTILIYATFTGLSGLSWSWQSYAVMRFLTGLGVGGEWAAGAAIVAEVFPDRSRPMALGTLQSLSAIGNMMAAVVTFLLAGLSWRYAYAVGALPALLVLWIRRSINEPQKWVQARSNVPAGHGMGNIAELFSNPTLRRNTIAGLLMAVAGQGALWGVGFWSVDLLLTVLRPYHLPIQQSDHVKSVVFFVQQIGAMIGIYAFALFSERYSRRFAFVVWFTLAWISIPLYFWGVSSASQTTLPALSFLHALPIGLPPAAGSTIVLAGVLALIMGFATLGPFSGYTLYFPELFPTRLRATGCGICYNGGRILAAAAPVLLSALSVHFAAKPGARADGMPAAATIVSCIYLLGFVGVWLGPETRGKPLPDEEADIATELS
jgi:MFS family permease